MQMGLDDALPPPSHDIDENVLRHLGEKILGSLNTSASFLAGWKSENDNAPSTVDRVTLLSSPEVSRLLAGFLGNPLAGHLQLFMESALFFSSDKQDSHASFPASLFREGITRTAFMVVQNLEAALAPSSLAKASLVWLQMIFLVLLGTLVTVGFTIWDPGNQKVRIASTSIRPATD